ncbi:hypothetical protein D3C80_1880370 [compost metagenome]
MFGLECAGCPGNNLSQNSAAPGLVFIGLSRNVNPHRRELINRKTGHQLMVIVIHHKGHFLLANKLFIEIQINQILAGRLLRAIHNGIEIGD